MGNKNKLQRFAENLTFPNLFQYRYEEVVKGFFLKEKWNREFFKNNHPLILELGCGKGEYTIGMARRYPEKNFIGVDIKGARLWRGLKTAQEENLKNVAFVRTRIELSEYYFGQQEVDELWITFPDPQIKASREKKRLTSPRFLKHYACFLKPDAVIHLKTDALLLYDYTREIIERGGHILLDANEDIYGSGVDNEMTQIQTFYEQKWLEYGTKIRTLAFKLNPELFQKNKEKMSHETGFFQRVYDVVRQVPYRRVTSYGAVAEYLGSKGSARMVGWALNSSKYRMDGIPAHRVVNRQGLLTGKRAFGGQNTMKDLLISEGVQVENDKILNFNEIFWDPSQELTEGF